MRSDIDMEGPAYAGRRSSRSPVFEGADEETVAVREIAVDVDDDEDDDDDDDGDLRLVLHLISFLNSVCEKISSHCYYGLQIYLRQCMNQSASDLMVVLARVMKLGNIDNELEREYEELRKQEEEVVNKLKRKRTDDQGKGDSVRHQRALWDRALEMRISMQKLVTGYSQLLEMEGKLELCTSDSQCEKAYHPLTKSAVAAVDCLLELKNALPEQNTAITEASAANVDGECGLILFGNKRIYPLRSISVLLILISISVQSMMRSL
ncbi:hypothetical protein KC19_VG247200 [Ceratodon purpureus]|uniref:AATF leucine zipper-containing domain-containing protein n=1 Tax=Ceratodon purpureus TaxID=3225 RepID=A0A8T0HUV5_CERPU|nr:hypothetical protein KC19_VG247200 [Ceratodon purpureus]